MNMELAKGIVTFVALFNVGGFIADGVIPSTARQHLYNSRWPPHAKFHNGQTMLLGILLCVVSLTILFGFRPLTFPIFLVAAATSGVYFLAMAFATIFPGVAWVDPEFGEDWPKPLGLNPQQLVSYVLLTLLGLAIFLAGRP